MVKDLPLPFARARLLPGQGLALVRKLGVQLAWYVFPWGVTSVLPDFDTPPPPAYILWPLRHGVGWPEGICMEPWNETLSFSFKPSYFGPLPYFPEAVQYYRIKERT